MLSKTSPLSSGENLVFRTHQHWLSFFYPALVLLLAGLVRYYLPHLDRVFQLLGLIGVVAVLVAFFSYISTAYIVTNERILASHGFFSRRGLSIPLDKVESVQVQQPFWARLFQAGTIVLVGTGGTRDVLYNVCWPWRFQAAVARARGQED
jgi:uncharacterized membrane protein YdbT with pleckstrin-like domain